MPASSSRLRTIARAKAKQLALAKRVAKANARLQQRRAALQAIKKLVLDLEIPLPHFNPKFVSTPLLAKILRVLCKRCTTDQLAEEFRQAMEKFVANGGCLPPGMSLVDATGSLDIGLLACLEERSFVPRHRILKMTFRLESSAFMLTYNSSTFTADSWPHFETFIKAVARTNGARIWGACLERSLHASSDQQEQVFHCHGYLIWTDGVGIRLRDMRPLHFEGVHPRIDVCASRGNINVQHAPRSEALHGLWYVTVLKEGTVKAATNYQAWVDYKPAVAWLQNLWEKHKLSHKAYLELSMRFRSGHSKRKRDVEDIKRQEQWLQVSQHVEAEKTALHQAQPLQPLRSFPNIDVFIDSFRQPSHRRPILVIVGATKLGKSLLANDVLRRVCQVLGLQHYLGVTVEGDESLDFSEFDINLHGGILLDGVGDVQVLWKHREVLQGRPKVTRGGRSNTMVYAYPYTLARRAVVATLDLTARNLHMLKTNHWMQDAGNVIVVRLNEPAWQPSVGDARPITVATTPTQAMASWTVSDVESFFHEQDASGLAGVIVQNAVTGTDLMSFTSWETLRQDLCLTPFAARKMFRLRNSFLRGDCA